MRPEATPAGRKPRAARVRVFFALWPDAATTHALTDLGRRCTPPAARRMRRDTLHLTLAFVGDIEARRLPRLAAIGDAMRWPSFVLTLDQIDYWSHNRIVWAGCRQPPPALTQLATDLGAALAAADFTLPDRAFTPHLTLARKVVDPHWQAPPFSPIEWPVSGARLVMSERDDAGARYRPLARWPDVAE